MADDFFLSLFDSSLKLKRIHDRPYEFSLIIITYQQFIQLLECDCGFTDKQRRRGRWIVYETTSDGLWASVPGKETFSYQGAHADQIGVVELLVFVNDISRTIKSYSRDSRGIFVNQVVDSSQDLFKAALDRVSGVAEDGRH